MKVWFFQFCKFDEDDILFSDDVGVFFRLLEVFLECYVDNQLIDYDNIFLKCGGYGFEVIGDFVFVGFVFCWM